MLSQHYVPPPPLYEFIECFWLYEVDVPTHKLERALPTGTVELIVNLRDDRISVYDRDDHTRVQTYRGPLISGPSSEYFVIDHEEQESVIGVHFKAGGASAFLNRPSDELHNQDAPLDALWGDAAHDLHDQLLAASTPEAKFRVLERVLLARLCQRWQPHPAVSFALNAFTLPVRSTSIAAVTDQIGLSARRFIEVFSQQVGLTPKLYSRVQRFQRVLTSIYGGRDLDWADLALSCGYFDQAHFIHDFRAFSGLNPTAYLEQRGRHPNHVPLNTPFSE